MKIAVASTIPAAPEHVFAALVDPAMLQRCIPGCESLTAVGDDIFEATLKVGVAGLKGTYSGKAAISDRRPPASLTLQVDGKGAPGFVRAAAVIHLVPDTDATRVVCDAHVQVGGLIAAVGSRLVEAAAKKLADDFFRQLSTEIANAAPLA